ncbi:MAG: D-alanyl-D-alanine carboxypeptidase [Lachnospiraceae bacterium]|nr:D-alanyl-D-alanine carboxypeptidase [Lachnospiraceae bacterium]
MNKTKLYTLFLWGALVCGALTGCGRVIDNDYESMMNSDQFNPTVIARESVDREKSFAHDLCLPEDTKAAGNPDFSLPSAGLFDLGNRTTMYGSGLTTRVFPASTTKLMTALVAVKHGNPGQTIRISEKAAYPGADAQRLVLEPGDSMTLEQALNYLLVFSANDCAIAIAENIAGSYDEFVDLMNKEARAIGATGTHFTNPHGLHDENHYTTPYDLYLILNEAVKYDMIRKILPQSGYNTMFTGVDGSSKSIEVPATDAYLTGDIQAPDGITVLGGKTGTTEPAGHCLIILSQNQKEEYYISVVMKTESLEDLYDGMNGLLGQIPN